MCMRLRVGNCMPSRSEFCPYPPKVSVVDYIEGLHSVGPMSPNSNSLLKIEMRVALQLCVFSLKVRMQGEQRRFEMNHASLA